MIHWDESWHEFDTPSIIPWRKTCRTEIILQNYFTHLKEHCETWFLLCWCWLYLSYSHKLHLSSGEIFYYILYEVPFCGLFIEYLYLWHGHYQGNIVIWTSRKIANKISEHLSCVMPSIELCYLLWESPSALCKWGEIK